MAPKVTNVTFNNSKTCPIIGLGTWKSKPGEVTQAVKDAIACGYRHIDGARCYQNEPEVGAGIAAKIADGTVKREDLFITTKLWLTSFQKDLVVPAIKQSLKDLGLTYVDLYLVHWPLGLKEGKEMMPVGPDGFALHGDGNYVDVWKGMEECVKLGLAKSIGVSNFNKRQIETILKTCEIRPVNNQVEAHPYLSQKKLIKYCQDNDITVTAYCPLGSPDRPEQSGEMPLLEEPKVLQLAKKYNKSPAQILIRYHIENGVIVVPKSVTKSRIESNLQVFDFVISPEDMEILEGLNQNLRYLQWLYVSKHKEYPFNDEY